MKSLRVYKLLVCALSLLPLTANSAQFGDIPRTQILGSATKADDTNVTLTLGGTPTDSFLHPVSFTLGWSGVLATARGGTGVGSLADITKVNDTNVTLTLGGTPVGSVINPVSFTLGWTGQLAVGKGGTGVSALGNITKVDDTNVTLTLGGTPTGAVITSTSFTLGWNGQLAVARGGTGAATAAANTVFGNNTGSTAAPGFQSLVATQIPALGGNPTINVGLAAVNGSATTYLRSDGAPALSQTIAPTWTGQHQFSEARTIASAAGAALNDVWVKQATTTITGTTTTAELNKVLIEPPGFTDSSAVTVTSANTVKIDGMPSNISNTTFTHPRALYVTTNGGGGVVRFDGELAVGAAGSVPDASSQGELEVGFMNAQTSVGVNASNTGSSGMLIRGAGPSGKFVQGTGSFYDTSSYTLPTTSGAAGYSFRSDGTNVASYPVQIINSSTSDQTGFASDTYLTGSNCVVAAGDFKAKGQYRCTFDMVKTAAGIATPIINVRVGTAGSVLDASKISFTFGAGTGVADTGSFEVVVTFRTVGSGTSAVVSGYCVGTHDLGTTGLFNNQQTFTIVGTTSSGFDSSAVTTIGVSFNGGASFSGTNKVVQSVLQQ